MNVRYFLVILLLILTIMLFLVQSFTLKILIIITQIALVIGSYAYHIKEKPDTKLKLILRVTLTMGLLLAFFAYYYLKAIKKI
jgi:hypothetical protein